MGDLIKAEFKIKLNTRLKRFNPDDSRREYQNEIFKELYVGFPQFRAHVSAYVERHYCIVLNDEEHAKAESVLKILSEEEVRSQNSWIIQRHGTGTITQRRS